MSTDSEGSEKKDGVRFVKMQGTGPITWFVNSSPNNPTSASGGLPELAMPDHGEEQEEVPDPEGTPGILECVVELRRRIALKKRAGQCSRRWPGDAYLAPPILDFDLGHISDVSLLRWVHFQPYRPIIATLSYAQVPGADEGLLTFCKVNPFQVELAAFGLIPGRLAREQIAKAAVALFAANGHESCLLFRGLPTSVIHCGNSCAGDVPLFGFKLAHLLFCISAGFVWPSNMSMMCDHMRRFPDPWERTTAALDFVERLRRGDEDPEHGEFNEDQFEEWFDLATQPSHVEAERLNFATAWEGAVRFRRERQAEAN